MLIRISTVSSCEGLWPLAKEFLSWKLFYPVLGFLRYIFVQLSNFGKFRKNIRKMLSFEKNGRKKEDNSIFNIGRTLTHLSCLI